MKTVALPLKKQKKNIFFLFSFSFFLHFSPNFCIYNTYESDIGDTKWSGNRSWDPTTIGHTKCVRYKEENVKIKATLIIHLAAAQPQRPRRSRNKNSNNGWMGGLMTPSRWPRNSSKNHLGRGRAPDRSVDSDQNYLAKMKRLKTFSAPIRQNCLIFCMRP